jgi:uncharacterized membrane protein YebE (DUF533 family)
METETGIFTVSVEQVQANLVEGQKAARKIDRAAIDLSDRQLLAAFGTIGFEAYKNWIVDNFVPSRIP